MHFYRMLEILARFVLELVSVFVVGFLVLI